MREGKLIMNTFFFLGILGMPGGSEVFIVAILIFFLFGAKKLPGLARSIGKSANEFKKGIRDDSPVNDDDEDDSDEGDNNNDEDGTDDE
jgi:sec-independent protein translocase protein TatA